MFIHPIVRPEHCTLASTCLVLHWALYFRSTRLYCPEHCALGAWFLELDQDFLQLLGLGPCHLLCCVYYIPLCDATFWLLQRYLDPSMAKQTCMIERIHSKFVHKLLSSYHSKFPFTLTEHCWFHTAVQIFESLRGISPPYLHEIFQFSRNVTGRLRCNVNQLFVPIVFTNYSKRSSYYRGTVLWNNLKSTVTVVAILLSFWNCYLNS